MSNESGNSSGTSVSRVRGRVVGVPKRCWCGELVVSLMSKSAANPYQRYYRCAFAVERKVSFFNINVIVLLVRVDRNVCVCS